MFVVTPSEMEEIDRLTIEEAGLSSLVLMENASRSCLQYVPPGPVTVLVGPGNNGGDGLVLARALSEEGRQVDILLLSPKLSTDAQTQLELAKKWDIPCWDYYPEGQNPPPNAGVFHKPVIIDALFGTGLSRDVEGRYAELINLVNKLSAHKLSIDIPSGINGKNGQILGTAVLAQQTVTFGCIKRGHLLSPGRDCSGLLHVTQPGFLPSAIASKGDVQLFTTECARDHLPITWNSMHKGHNGRLLLVTGSKAYPGAGILTVLGALSAGAGLVSQSVDPEQVGPLLQHAPEAMPIPRSVLPDLSKFDALVIGSGLGSEAQTLGKQLLSRCELPCVIDADCLSLVRDLPKDTLQRTVITPHPGELARLLGKTSDELEHDRIQTALEAAQELGCTVCYKGSPTITASPDRSAPRAYVNTTGNPVLAQGGTGDLLAGIIGAYLAGDNHLEPFQAATCGAYIHGLAADLAAEMTLKMADASGPCSVKGLTSHRIAELVPIAYSKAVGNRTSFPVF